MKSRFLFLLSVVLMAISMSACSEPPYTNINNNQLQELQKQGVQVIDIRRPEEWRQTGVVEGSTQLTAFDKSGRLTENFLPVFESSVNKDTPVVLICRTGNRTSALAGYLSKELGYSKVYNVSGGITSWMREGKPVSQCDQC